MLTRSSTPTYPQLMSYNTTNVRTVKRARRLADLLMQEMYAGLRDPARLSSEEWDKLFGAKQSMISNLHKLVSTLAALPEATPIALPKASKDSSALSKQEMEMLKAWLEEGG
jgi:hypothetical protein